MFVQDWRFHLSLIPQSSVCPGKTGIEVAAHGRSMLLRSCPPSVAAAVSQLANAGATKDALTEEVLQGGTADLFSLLGVLRILDDHGTMQRTLMVEGKKFCSYVPLSGDCRFLEDLSLPALHYKLSRLSYIRCENGVANVRSPLGRAMIDLHDPRAVTLALALARPHSPEEFEFLVPDMDGAGPRALLLMLQNAACLEAEMDEAPRPDALQEASTWWEFHDVLFHMRSRRGRHSAPYGGTFRYKGMKPPPLIRPASGGAIIALPQPDLENLRSSDAPLVEVMERRRSIRSYGDTPLSLEQLGEFLYRSSRYQRILPGDDTDYALRAAPAGGALHELEIYPVVVACNGIDPGVYRYRPAEHAIEHVAEPSPRFDRLVEDLRRTSTGSSAPSIGLQITARCQRVFWKYESMAYALILKNLGALYATMYMAATAMNLAPCALGGGDSELFSAIAGLDPLEEPTVGEFALGARGVSR